MPTVNFTTNLALALPTTGDLTGTWGTEVNTGISELVDQALGFQAFTATGGSDTLTIPDAATGVARSIYIQLNGTGGGTVNVPTTKQRCTLFLTTLRLLSHSKSQARPGYPSQPQPRWP